MRSQPLNSLSQRNNAQLAQLSKDELRAVKLLVAEEYGLVITEGLASIMDFEGLFDGDLGVLINSRLSAFDNFADHVGFEL